MAENSQYTSMSKEQVFSTLRREILAAQLKVELDKQLKRDTSSTVKRLANMKLPALDRSVVTVDDYFVEPGRPTRLPPTGAPGNARYRLVRDPGSTIERSVPKGGFQKRAKTARASTRRVSDVQKNAATDSTAVTQK